MIDSKTKLAILTAMQTGVKEATDQARAEVANTLDAAGDTKALYIGNEQIASATLAQGKTTAKPVILDVDAFLDWCYENQLVLPIAIPSNWYGTSGFLECQDDGVWSRKTGEMVPGLVTMIDRSEPTFKVTKKKKRGETDQEWVERAFKAAGEQMMLEAITSVPALEGGE